MVPIIEVKSSPKNLKSINIIDPKVSVIPKSKKTFLIFVTSYKRIFITYIISDIVNRWSKL